MADRLAEVGRPEENRIDSRLCADFVEFRKRFGVFDLYDDHAVFVHELNVVPARKTAVLSIGIAPVDGTPPERMKTGFPDDFPCLVRAHEMGNHNSCGVGFQRADVIAVGALRHPDDDICIVSFCRKNLLFHGIEIGRDMFAADPDAVESGEGCLFGCAGTGEVVFERECFFSRTQFVQDDTSPGRTIAHIEVLCVKN